VFIVDVRIFTPSHVHKFTDEAEYIGGFDRGRPVWLDSPVGQTSCHRPPPKYSAIDDASRIAFCQVMSDEKQESAVAFLKAALSYYKSPGKAWASLPSAS
jgi:hypothetical protein